MVATLMRRIATAAVWCLVVACGDNASYEPVDGCDLEDLGDYKVLGCRQGAALAVRYSNEILLQDDEWAEYRRVITSVYCSEPRTRIAVPDPLAGWRGEYDVLTTHPPLVEAWSRAQIATRISTIDAIFVDTATSVEHVITDFYRLRFPRPISIEEISRRLDATAIPDTRGPDLIRDANDVTVSWAGDLAQLLLVGGWGDCWTGCEGLHWWSATVGPDNAVEVWDLGGDAIPERYDYDPESDPFKDACAEWLER